MMRAAFIIIATGEAYANYAKNLVESMHKHLLFDPAIFVFTNKIQALQNTGKLFYIEPKGYPKETLYRYHTILSKERIFKDYDQLFYVDADMKFASDILLGDISSSGITATLHPGYVGQRGTPETRPESTACTDTNTAYYCGGFQGGNTDAYLQAARNIAAAIDADDKNDITAVWHDESHWNRYLTAFPPARVLTPSFCYPDVRNDYYRDKWIAAGLGKVEPKLLALTKEGR